MPLPKPQLIDLDDPLRGKTSAPSAAPGATAAGARDMQPATPTKRQRATDKPARSHGRNRPQAGKPASRSHTTPVDPYHGSPKIAVNIRATKALWDQLGDIVRELEQEGHRTSRTEITEALWHLNGPRNADEAVALIVRYQLARRGHSE